MSWLSKLTGKGDGASSRSAGAARGGPPSAPRIIIDRKEYEPEEFLLGSFRVRPYDGDLIAKQQFDFKLAFSLGEESFEVTCRGIVTRANEQAGLVARFLNPQPYYERKLVEFLRLWKGV